MLTTQYHLSVKDDAYEKERRENEENIKELNGTVSKMNQDWSSGAVFQTKFYTDTWDRWE